MQMDGWQDRLHSSFLGEHVLFGSLRLNSYSSFLLASLLTIGLCLAERALTYAMSVKWSPLLSRRSRFRRALWRTSLYWVVTLARLLYMLISMTFHVGLIFVIVTSLASGQFVIEYLDSRHPDLATDPDQANEPLLGASPYDDRPVALEHIATRPRSKSKPGDIFIHPNASNVARADAYALQLGLGGETENIKDAGYHGTGDTWEQGKGREIARELLGHRRQSSSIFHIGDKEDEPDTSSDLSH